MPINIYLSIYWCTYLYQMRRWADCPLEIHSAARWAIVDVDNVHNDEDDVNGPAADAGTLLTIKWNANAAFLPHKYYAY